MGLVPMGDLLTQAKEYKFAVGGFDLLNLEMLAALEEAATEATSPIILMIAEVHFKYLKVEDLAPAIRKVAQEAPIPVAVHLDHGVTLEAIMRAIRAGFSSVMFDGSKLPFEENVEKTADIVRFAHACGVTVEAELGHVGGGEGALTPKAADEAAFTDPVNAAEFVRRTGVDALAIAVGNVHGIYKGEPNLDFDRIARIRDLCDIPLVLHGGSGISDDDFRKAISLGIAKINIYTEMQMRLIQYMREYITEAGDKSEYTELLLHQRRAVREVAVQKMKVFGTYGLCGPNNPACLNCGGCDVRANFADKAPTPSTKATAPVASTTVEAPDRAVIEAITRQVMDKLAGK